MTIELSRAEVNLILWGLRIIYGIHGDHEDLTRKLMERLEQP